MRLFKTILAAAIACSLFYSYYPKSEKQNSVPTVSTNVPCTVTESGSLLSPEYNQPDTLKELIPKDSQNTLVLCTDGSGALYDTIFIAAHSSSQSTLRMISLPRDIYVPYNQDICNELSNLGLLTSKGIFKLNAVGSIGKLINYPSNRFNNSEMAFMADILQEMTGVTISEYAIVGFDTFKNLVDTVGGVTVNVSCDIRSSDGTLLLAQGSQTLNGTQALLYARARTFYDAQGNQILAAGDHTRKEHQLTMIQEVIPQLTQKASLTKLPQLINILRKEVKHSFSISEMYKYYRLAQSVSAGKTVLETHVITGPGIDPMQDGCSYIEFQ